MLSVFQGTRRRQSLPRLGPLESVEVRLLLTASALISELAAPNSVHAANSATVQQIASFVQTQITGANLAGVSVAVVRGDAVLMSAGYGTANFQLGKQINADTPFMIASVSKAVTAVAAMQLVDSGQLDLDRNINDYLPFNVANPNHPNKPITARMLMTHSSSIIDNDTFTAIEYSEGDSPVPLGDLMRGYLTPGADYYSRDNFLQAAPGQSAEYSNMGSAMLGYLVEEVSEQPFDEFSKQKIFDPLGMSNTSWKLAGFNPDDVAMPYEYSGTNHVASGHYGFPDYPNGQLRSSANDMARFLRAFIGDGELQGTRILSATSTAEMRRLQIPRLDDSIGLTWFYDQVDGQSTLGHNGGETGANTFMFYRPSDGVGVIVFTNTSASNEDFQDDQNNAMTDIAAELFKQASQLVPVPLLTVSIFAASISENGGATTATVSRTEDTTDALIVNLSSSDTSEATVPATVTIEAGQTTSAAFSISSVDDSDVDGTQSITITASATGTTSGTDTIDVTNDDTTTGFVVTAPTGMIDTIRPTISWTAVDGALSYNVFLNIDNGGGNVFTQGDVNSSQTSIVIPQDLEFARYRVFVEANIPGSVLKKQDQGHTFVVNVKSQLTPIGATTATSPQFTWNRVPGAARYRIFINVPGGAITAEITDPGSGTTASHTITSALPRNDYKWWVRAIRDVSGTDFLGPWSEASEFSTGGRTKATSPTRNSTVTNGFPEFTWPAVSDALRYEVYVAKTGTPGALYRDPGITRSSVRARSLGDGDYKVWIRSTMANGSGVWGSGIAFSVATTTTSLRTTPTSPTTPGFSSTPQFAWQETAGATSYDIYLHNGTSSILESGRTGTSWTPITALADGA